MGSRWAPAGRGDREINAMWTKAGGIPARPCLAHPPFSSPTHSSQVSSRPPHGHEAVAEAQGDRPLSSVPGGKEGEEPSPRSGRRRKSLCFPVYLISQIGAASLVSSTCTQSHMLLLNTLRSTARPPVRTTCKDFGVPIVPDWFRPAGIPAESWRERRQGWERGRLP